jgi:hypothetical protein
MTFEPKIHGVMAQFLTPEEILNATRRARQAGYRVMDAYTPYTVEGLSTELGMRRSRLPSVVLIGGLVGAGSGFFMQYYTMAVDYPFNSGGRPLNSWPAFIPITFELLILVAALSAFLGLMLLAGLPHPNHPVFNVPEFVGSSQDRFFLCIEATDPQFDIQATTAFLVSLAPHGDVFLVPVAPEAQEEETLSDEQLETEEIEQTS